MEKEILERYIKLIDEIEKESFWRFNKENLIGTSMKFDDDLNVTYDKTFPSNESLKSFLLFFRQFFQQNDSMNIKKIHDAIVVLNGKTPIPEVTEAYRLYNRVLKDPYGPEIPTIEELIRIYLYGYYAHSDKDYVKKYEDLKADDEGMEMHHFFFLLKIT